MANRPTYRCTASQLQKHHLRVGVIAQNILHGAFPPNVSIQPLYYVILDEHKKIPLPIIITRYPAQISKHQHMPVITISTVYKKHPSTMLIKKYCQNKHTKQTKLVCTKVNRTNRSTTIIHVTTTTHTVWLDGHRTGM